jgi:hypothetical protein
LFHAPAEIDDGVVEVDRRARSDLLVGPALIEQQLSAAFRKRPEMRVESIDILVHGICLRGVAVEIEGLPVPAGVLVDDVAELVPEELRWIRPAGETRPAQLRAGLQPREDNLT